MALHLTDTVEKRKDAPCRKRGSVVARRLVASLSGALVLGVLGAGCGTTVHRLGREPQLPAGPAMTSCEKRDWLVLAPTRASIADPGQPEATNVEGAGAYRVGSDDPVDITTLDPGDPIVFRRRSEVRPYYTRRYIALGLGVLGAGAMGIGTGTFIGSFQSTQNPDGSRVQNVNGDQAAAGAITVGIGFALGIAGILVNPDQAERTRLNAARYFFDPRQNPPDDAERLIREHDEGVRERCEHRP